MDFDTIRRRHHQDIMIRWAYYLTAFALASVIVGCAYKLSSLKPDQVEDSDRGPADVGQVEHNYAQYEVIKLRDENAKLRAALIETQQKLALSSPKRRRQETQLDYGRRQETQLDYASVPKQPAITKIKKSQKVQRVADVRRKKKPKVIQVSFEEERNN